MAEEIKPNFWMRLRREFRLAIVDEDTLIEVWHTRLSRLSAIIYFTLMFILTLGLFSVLIIFTPIRAVLPGYSENIRQQVLDESMRVDSLTTELELQRQYLSVVRDVVAGEVKSDTIQSLDSLQIVMREQLLQAKSEATADFIAQYEQREKNDLTLFNAINSAPIVTFFRPAHGVVTKAYAPAIGHFGVAIQSPKEENVTSVLDGTIIQIIYEINDTYSIVLQHDAYISIYRHTKLALKHVGDVVQAGESIAIVSDDKPLYFELWKNGVSINPQEVIAF